MKLAIADASDHIYDSNVFIKASSLVASPDLVGLEVSQSVQDLNDSVPLVTNKPAIVRAHIQSKPNTGAIQGVRARLFGTRNGVDLPGSPLPMSNPSGTIIVDQNALQRRGNLDDSANFFLPDSWRSGTITLRVEGVTNVLDCKEQAGTPNDCSVTVAFASSGTPQVKWVLVEYSTNGVTHIPNVTGIVEQENRLQAMYPISSLDSTLGWVNMGTGQPTLPAVNSRLSSMRFWDLCWGPFGPVGCTRLYYGVVQDANLGGLAESIPGNVASGGVFGADFGVLRNVPSHEIGHLLGRNHAVNSALPLTNGLKQGYCGEVASGSAPDFPFTTSINGQTYSTIGPMDQGDQARIYGYDSHAQRVADPSQNFELMSYCGYKNGLWEWTSSYTYSALRDAIASRFGVSAAAVPAAATSGTFQIVEGTIDLNLNTANVAPINSLATATTPPAMPVGPYAVVVRDANGAILQQVPFAPNVSAPLADSVPDQQHLLGSFIVPVNADPNAVRIDVVSGTTVLASRFRSPNSPQVHITAPTAGQALTGATGTFSWSASDPDNDALSYIVQLSTDCGQSYSTIASNYAQTSLAVPLNTLRGATCALLRVRASDGFNSALDTSASFSIGAQAPRLSITSPVDGSEYTIDQDQVVDLEGAANDPQDGALAAANLKWLLVDTGQSLGTGKSLHLTAASLAVGKHTVRLTATDSAGQTASVDVTIRVLGFAPLDTTAPSCVQSSTGLIAGTSFLKVSTQDLQSGLRSVDVSNVTNATVDVAAFGQGTDAAVTVTLFKTAQANASHADLAVRDVAGNLTNCSFDLAAAAADTTPPTTTATTAPTLPASSFTNHDVSVTLSAIDDANGSGVDTTFVAVDSTACGSTALLSCSIYTGPISITTEGTHTVGFFSVDKAGNAESVHTLTIKIDRTPPHAPVAVVTGGVAGNNGWFTSSPNISLAAIDDGSGTATIYYQFVKHGATAPTNALPGAWKTFSATITALDGDQDLYAFAVDTVGNAGAPVNAGEFKVDSTKPTITAQLTPAPSVTGWNGGTVTVTWTCTDPGGSGTATCSPSTTVTATGTTQVTGTATDAAGNTTTATQAVKIDKTRPTCVLSGSGTDATGHTFILITVQDSQSGLGSVLVTEHNNANVAVPAFAVGATNQMVITATKITQGTSSQVALNVTDAVGNVTSCDPILTEVGNDGPGGVPRRETFHHVARAESHVTILNGTPGLDAVKLVVNGKVFEERRLADGESRSVDVSSAMHRGNNTITVVAQGRDQGTAVILIADS
jgi:hypothetical protein